MPSNSTLKKTTITKSNIALTTEPMTKKGPGRPKKVVEKVANEEKIHNSEEKMDPNLESLLDRVSDTDSDCELRIVTSTYSSSNKVEKFWNIPRENLQEFWVNYCTKTGLQNSDPYANFNASEIITDTTPLILEFTLSFPKEEGRTYYDENFLQKMCRVLQYTIMESCYLDENQNQLTCCVMESSVWEDTAQQLDFVKFRFQFPYCVLELKDINGIIKENLFGYLKSCNPLESLLVRPTKVNWDEIIDTFGSSSVALYGSDQYFKRPKIQLSHIWRSDDLTHLDSNSKRTQKKISEVSVGDIFDPRYHDHVENHYIDCSVFFSEADIEECGDIEKISDDKINKEIWLPLFFSVNYNKNITEIIVPESENVIEPKQKIPGTGKISKSELISTVISKEAILNPIIENWNKKHGIVKIEDVEYNLYDDAIRTILFSTNVSFRSIVYMFKYYFGQNKIKAVSNDDSTLFYRWNEKTKLWEYKPLNSTFNKMYLEFKEHMLAELYKINTAILSISDEKSIAAYNSIKAGLQVSIDKWVKATGVPEVCAKVTRELLRHENIIDERFCEYLDNDPFSFPIGEGKIIRFKKVTNEWTYTIDTRNENDYFSKTSRIKFNPTASREKFEKFLGDITLHDLDLIIFFKRILGEVILGIAPKSIIILIGQGNNGKSTLSHIISQVLGEFYHSASHKVLTSDTSKDGGPDNDISELLDGKRACFLSEVPERQKLNIATLKSLTGGEGDKVSARKVYGKKTTRKVNRGTIWVPCNHLFDIPVQKALKERIIIIDMLCEMVNECDLIDPNDFNSKEEMNTHLKKHHGKVFRSERTIIKDKNFLLNMDDEFFESVLLTMIDGAQYLLENLNNDIRPQSTIDRLAEVMETNDPIANFVQNCLAYEDYKHDKYFPKGFVSSTDLFQAFSESEYCEDSQIKQNAFIVKLKSLLDSNMYISGAITRGQPKCNGLNGIKNIKLCKVIINEIINEETKEITHEISYGNFEQDESFNNIQH